MGLYHIFVSLPENEINDNIKNIFSDISVLIENKKNIKIHDNLIQVMLASKRFVNLQSYNYKNDSINKGLAVFGCTVFHGDQIKLFYKQIDLFEKNIDTPEIVKLLKDFSLSSTEVINTLKEWKCLLLETINNGNCIYHLGI